MSQKKTKFVGRKVFTKKRSTASEGQQQLHLTSAVQELCSKPTFFVAKIAQSALCIIISHSGAHAHIFFFKKKKL